MTTLHPPCAPAASPQQDPWALEQAHASPDVCLLWKWDLSLERCQHAYPLYIPSATGWHFPLVLHTFNSALLLGSVWKTFSPVFFGEILT